LVRGNKIKSGNVGIGTTSPGMILTVAGNANISGTLYKGTTAYTNPDIAEKIPSTQILEEGDLVAVGFFLKRRNCHESSKERQDHRICP